MSKFPVDREYITSALSDLVSIDSVNPSLVPGGAGEGEIADYLEKVCRKLGFEVELQETAPGRPNVIAKWQGSGSGRSLLLTGHMDVVSVEGMEIAPFDPVIKDGKLHGRGSFDMKGGLAAILGAAHALISGEFEPIGDLYLGFVTDEEYKSIGTEALVKKIKPDAVILTEPTDLEICIAHKGFVWIKLTTYGVAAHGSSFESGIDAIANMGKLLDFLKTLEEQELPKSNHPLLVRPSVHASLIEGGLGLSTYPDRCELLIEHRLLPNQTADEAKNLWSAEIARIQREDEDFNGEVNVEFFRPGYEIAEDSAIVQAVSEGFRKVISQEPSFVGTPGWLDSAILGGAGIPTVIIGPGGDGAHAAVEYVDLESVFRCAEVLAVSSAWWLKSG